MSTAEQSRNRDYAALDTFAVVRNDEDQHSIWPSGRELPPGWVAEGFTGTREECLSHVDEVWTDLRPRSLREVPLREVSR